MGLPAPHLLGWLTIAVEILGGLAVLLGALVPLVSIPMAIVLLTAMFTVHSLRLPLDQASGNNGRRRAVRAAGL